MNIQIDSEDKDNSSIDTVTEKEDVCETAALGMVPYYKHFLKNLFRDTTDIHQLKNQTFSEMPDWAVEMFARIKWSLLKSKALAAPKFTMLQQNLFIVGINFSAKAIGVTFSQVQRGRD